MDVPTKVIPIKYCGVDETVTIKKINLRERNQAYREAMQVKFIGSGKGATPQSNIDPWVLQESIMLKSIVKAPFPISVQGIGELDPNLADFIHDEIDKFNNPTEEKKEN